MRKFLMSSNELLHLMGLEKRPTVWAKSLPIALGVGAGLVAGLGVSYALLTPARRKKVEQGVDAFKDGTNKLAQKAKDSLRHVNAPGTVVAPSAHA